jgi:hypothetical protein
VSEVREEGGLGFHRDVVVVLVPPHCPSPPEVPPIDEATVTVLLHRPSPLLRSIAPPITTAPSLCPAPATLISHTHHQCSNNDLTGG